MVKRLLWASLGYGVASLLGGWSQAGQDPVPLTEAVDPPNGAASFELVPTIIVRGSRLGPTLSPTGANDYGVSDDEIHALPSGDNTTITDVIAQLPGVAIDQNQQIHIRNTEGPQFQYQINGILVPLDINTNPPFISNLNAKFVGKLDLLDGILSSRYSYATGGVIDIHTKDGCNDPGGSLSLVTGQRGTIIPSAQYAGCDGSTSYYVSGQYQQSNTAFSSATPGPDPIHDHTSQGQFFGFAATPISDNAKLSVILSTGASDNQLPNVANLTPQYSLDGVSAIPSAAINSRLNFQDSLAIVAVSAAPSDNFSAQIAYGVHSISQNFEPDIAGELIYQGVASTATHHDIDNTLQGDLVYQSGRHTLAAGAYLGAYHVIADDRSAVFAVDATGNQTSDIPVRIVNDTHATNLLAGLYIDDLWQLTDRLRLNLGLRWDSLTGFSNNNQLDPTLNLVYDISPRSSLHAGFARYFQVPSFQGISPSAPAAFAGTTAASPPGVASPRTEDDLEWDAGIVHRLTDHLTLSQDAFYEVTRHYLDTGQFGVVPIFAPFNYGHGTIWGSESSVRYKDGPLSAYGNLTIGVNQQQGVATGQFNFSPDELAFIDAHHIDLDHQPRYGASAGASYAWAPVSVTIDLIYSSGLRAGFADLQRLPPVVQINAGAELAFEVPGVGSVTNRVTILNIADRTDLIRPAEGIGIFQAAYEPRRTFLETLTLAF